MWTGLRAGQFFLGYSHEGAVRCWLGLQFQYGILTWIQIDAIVWELSWGYQMDCIHVVHVVGVFHSTVVILFRRPKLALLTFLEGDSYKAGLLYASALPSMVRMSVQGSQRLRQKLSALLKVRPKLV